MNATIICIIIPSFLLSTISIRRRSKYVATASTIHGYRKKEK